MADLVDLRTFLQSTTLSSSIAREVQVKLRVLSGSLHMVESNGSYR